MGVVYKARQVGLDRLVALKMILAGAGARPEDLGRFRAEAQAVARFQHPSIVQIYEVGEADGLPYFSLEFVDGGTLAGKIHREPQPPQFAAETIEVLARAMQYAHDRGVVHRDLKPANVLLAIDLVQLHQPFHGLSQADLAVRRDVRLPVPHPRVAVPEQRLGLGVILLAQQGPAHCPSPRPVTGPAAGPTGPVNRRARRHGFTSRAGGPTSMGAKPGSRNGFSCS
jgi:serine/threonine protein kinase